MPRSVFAAKLAANRQKYYTLLRLLAALLALIFANSVLFHLVMAFEDRSYPIFTGIYWTLTTMSTLGFGDIVFKSTLGQMFSTMVLVSGMVSFLILLPVAFIRFFYEPWFEAREAARTPRSLPESMKDHVILTKFGPVAVALVEKLTQFSIPYVFVLEDEEEALKLHDRKFNIVIGELSDPRTYKNVNANQAAMVAATGSDVKNTSSVFTVRGFCSKVPIVATADHHDSVDILELAGSTHVIEVAEMLGFALARRVSGGDSLSHEIGNIGEIIIAEANVSHTPLVGKKLFELDLRKRFGINVAGLWERGTFRDAAADVEISETSVVVLVGTRESMKLYDEEFGKYQTKQAPVIIVGGGRVGQSTARALEMRGVDYCIVEKDPDILCDDTHVVRGDAAAIKIMEKAGIKDCSAVIVTTNDDDINVYLTLYFRKLRPELQIISRVTLERNVKTLHRAGADFILSYSSMGANVIFNLLKSSDVLMIAEGLDIFTQKIPKSLVGKTIVESEIRPTTGCSVVALVEDDEFSVSPAIDEPLPANAKLVLIGDPEAEKRFLTKFSK